MVKGEDIAQLINVADSRMMGKEILQAKSITDPEFDAFCIGWCSAQNGDFLSKLRSGVVLVGQELYDQFGRKDDNLILLAVSNPRSSFLQILNAFFAIKAPLGIVHSTSTIDSSVRMDKRSVNIGPNVVIEEGCVIGNNVVIGANTVVKSNTLIGDFCNIGSNTTIGGVGFGYEPNEEGVYELMPHIGNVEIGNYVEIGNNVCIDRAVMGATRIGDHAKIDNLVHIAHGVEIGSNSLIIAHAMIAGSVKVGENVWIAPSSSIRQKLHIGDNAIVGMGSVVVKNVAADTTVAGNPAKLFPSK